MTTLVSVLCAECKRSFNASAKEVNRGNARFCSLRCAAVSNNRNRPDMRTELVCSVCSVIYKIKQSAKEASKFCSRLCADTGRVKTGEYRAKREAFETLPNVCFHCGSVDDLLLHHKDKDHYNNDPNNWRIVCRSCHILVEHRDLLESLNIKRLSVKVAGIRTRNQFDSGQVHQLRACNGID